jgi:hypothetical protein
MIQGNESGTYKCWSPKDLYLPNPLRRKYITKSGKKHPSPV